MRAFVAIELSADVKAALQELSNRLRACRVRASWVKPDNMHLTLRFLGEISDESVTRLAEAVAEPYAALDPFELAVKGTGAFPNLRKPSVVWAGVGPLDGGLSEAHAIAEDGARQIGLKPEKRRFHPHLTLSRIKDLQHGSKLAPYLTREKDFDGGSFRVESVSLFSSELKPKGAVYTRVKEFRF